MRANISIAGSLLGLLCLVPTYFIHAAEGVGIPISERVLIGTVTVDGSTIDVAVREGTLWTLGVLDSEKIVGFSPAIIDETQGGVLWLPLEIEDSGNGQRLTQFADPLPSSGSELLALPFPSGALSGSLQVHKIRNWAGFPTVAPAVALDSPPSTLRALFGRSSGNSCCVSCGSLTVCATSVRFPACGSCQDAGGVPLPGPQHLPDPQH